MNATAPTAPKTFDALGRMWSVLASLPRDEAFRFSLKFGIAGMLAVYVALLNKNHQPTWALFTVFVLMVAQYIGAIEEKSLLRMVGTIVGGFVGYLLTSSIQQDAFLYLGLLGLFVAITTAMFGQARYPYAFLLCGMTAVVVCSNGLAQPQNSWIFMIWRIQEVGIGIVAVLLVQSLLWPRYAADEFLSGLRGVFLDLRILHDAVGSAHLQNAAPLQARFDALRQLLRFGARESRYFRSKFDSYRDLLASARRIHSAIKPLVEIQVRPSFYRENAASVIKELHASIGDMLEELSNVSSTPESRRSGLARINAAFDALKGAIRDLRHDPRSREVPLDDVLEISLRILSLEEIQAELDQCVEILDDLPRKSKKPADPSFSRFVPGIPPSFWIKNGIRSALSLIAAMIFMNWVHPPGGTTMVLCAWLFCCLLPLSPEGRGDHRAWHVVAVVVPCLLLFALCLILAAPLLSSYAVMNCLIFSWLFLYGQTAYRTSGVSTVMNVSMMALIGVLGLNGQQPVQFQAIADVFFGISTGTVIAAFFQRTLWPVLPQREMRDRFVELIDIQRSALATGAPTIEQRVRLSQLPGEIQTRIANLSASIFMEPEVRNLKAVLEGLDCFSANRIWESLQFYSADGEALAGRMRECFSAILEKIGASFARGTVCVADTAPLRSLINESMEWTKSTRLRLMAENADPLAVVTLVGRAARYQKAGEHLLASAETAALLNTFLHSRDASL